MQLYKGLRVRLANTGDPPPHHFIREDGPGCVRWGVNRQDLGVAVTEEAAVEATWRRFRNCALVPEAGAMVVEVGRVSSGAEIAVLRCRQPQPGAPNAYDRLVGYPTSAFVSGWELEPDDLVTLAATSDKSRRAGL